MGIYHRLLKHWQHAGVAVRPPASSDEIAALEKRRRVRLPVCFKSYLATVGGMEEGQWDDETISFLTLPLIEANTDWNQSSGDAVDLVFAEFLIFSHVYAIRLSEDQRESPVYTIHGKNELQLADSFEEFLEAYLTDAEAIADCWAKAPIN